MRPRTWRRVRRWGFIGTASVFAILIIGGITLPQLLSGSGSGGGGDQPDRGIPGAEINDHWHASLKVGICGDRINLPISPGGIHSHGDDRIHIHPQQAGEEGNNANLGYFFNGLEMVMESDRIQAPERDLYENGQNCPDGDPGTVQVKVNGEDMTETFRSYLILDGDRVEVKFE